jgi:RNA polymerase subunit RPABC4/transcription elongation factor Spt4
MAMVVCKNGHMYDSSKNSSCPYCPSSSVNEDEMGETIFDSDNDKTEIIDTQTEKIEELSDGRDKTQIHKPMMQGVSDKVPLSGRKLVGWLVTFTLNANGQDFRLYEGKTTIGAGKKCDIVINDAEISAHHATILYRNGKFKIKDEFTTNGTFVNGEMIDDVGSMEDKSEIKMGRTIFLFRMI